MSLPLVEIVAGTETPVREGATGAVKCLVRYADGSTRAAIVKRNLPPEKVAAEAFCALLLRGWGLSVPDPAIVAGPPLAFACTEVTYPNLKQRVGWSDRLPPQVRDVMIYSAAKLVSSFAETPLALVADEAIENVDRNLGNILWDGEKVAWIDHDQTFKLGKGFANKLAGFVVASGNYAAVETTAVSLALALGLRAIVEAEQACAGFPEGATYGQQVTQRLSSLAGLVLARFPRPPDLLAKVE